MPTGMWASAEAAARYGGVDPHNPDAVDHFYAKDIFELSEARRVLLYEELLAADGAPAPEGWSHDDVPYLIPHEVPDFDEALVVTAASIRRPWKEPRPVPPVRAMPRLVFATVTSTIGLLSVAADYFLGLLASAKHPLGASLPLRNLASTISIVFIGVTVPVLATVLRSYYRRPAGRPLEAEGSPVQVARD